MVTVEATFGIAIGGAIFFYPEVCVSGYEAILIWQYLRESCRHLGFEDWSDTGDDFFACHVMRKRDASFPNVTAVNLPTVGCKNI